MKLEKRDVYFLSMGTDEEGLDISHAYSTYNIYRYN
jgi:hypothetical protein